MPFVFASLGCTSKENGNSFIIFIPIYLFVEIEASPVRCLVSEVKSTACGADFTVWLTSAESSSILYALLADNFQAFWPSIFLITH